MDMNARCDIPVRHLLIVGIIGIEERVVVGQQIDLGHVWRHSGRWTIDDGVVGDVLRGVEFAVAVGGGGYIINIKVFHSLTIELTDARPTVSSSPMP